MGRWAIIDETSCGTPEDAETLRPFMRTFEEIGRRWKVPVIVDYRAKPVEVSDYKKWPKDSVYFHIAASRHGAKTPLYEIESIFGYKSGSLLKRWPMWRWYIPAKGVISLPDRELVAEIDGVHIFVLIDLLSATFSCDGKPARQWYLDPIRNILKIIFHSSLAKIAKGKADDPVCTLLNKRTGKLAAILKRSMKIHKGRLVSSISQALEYWIDASLERADLELRALEKEIDKIQTMILAAREQIAEISYFLKQVTPIKTDSEYAELFEECLRIEGVSRIDVDSKHIMVLTERLSQFVHETNQNYDIGSFIITLNPEHASRFSVDITQVEPGPYSHYHAATYKSEPICFGATLNEMIDKLAHFFDVLNLLHLVISFLRVENTPPPQNIAYNASDTATRETQIRSSQNEKQNTKERFVEFMKEAHLKARTKYNRTRLEKHEAQEAQLAENLGHAKRELNEMVSYRGYLFQRMCDTHSAAQNQLEEFFKNPKVVYWEYDSGLRVYIYDENNGIYAVWLRPSRSWLISSKVARQMYAQNDEEMREYFAFASLDFAGFVNLISVRLARSLKTSSN